MLRTLATLLLLDSALLAQVRVGTVGTQFRAHEQINVQVTNAGKKTASYCVEFTQISFKTGAGTVEDMEHTPIPFYVQKQNGRRWSTLLIGPDIGSSRRAVILKPGESQQYTFRLSDRGRMRLVLEYWDGETERACTHPQGKRKETRSNVFVVN